MQVGKCLKNHKYLTGVLVLFLKIFLELVIFFPATIVMQMARLRRSLNQ